MQTRLRLFISVLLVNIYLVSPAQDADVVDTVDFPKLMGKLFSGNKPTKQKKPSKISLLPAIGYNPTFGLMLGGTLVAGTYLGNPKTTNFSTGAATAFVTTKKIINVQVRHNVFTADNIWNLQGNFQASRMALVDYGLGTDSGSYRMDPLEDPNIGYPLRFGLFRLNQKLYRKIGKNLYVGGGVNIDYHKNIDDEKLNVDSMQLTPHYIYSQNKDISPTNYWSNGFMANIQYNNREHPNQSHGGMYADLVVRSNQPILGSSRRGIQLITEFRKYWSLSKRTPEKVLAIWHLATFRLTGEFPYLDLPGTQQDLFNRSGRAYTQGRFRGPSYFYFETEYRFPITANKLLGGTVFMNWQTASDDLKLKLFENFIPAAGAGLRILFNRNTRTNLCIDYAIAWDGSKGFFFGLNEAF
jgi:outer membrane protein assembly factor BamA